MVHLKAEFRRSVLLSHMARFANQLTQGPSGRYMSHAPDEWHKDFMSMGAMQNVSHPCVCTGLKSGSERTDRQWKTSGVTKVAHGVPAH